MTKIHPLTLLITFGMDVGLLPHANVNSDTIFRHIQAGYSIPQLCKSVHFFRGFPHKLTFFFYKLSEQSLSNLEVYWRKYITKDLRMRNQIS